MHTPLALTGRLIGVLCPVIEIAVLTMFGVLWVALPLRRRLRLRHTV